MRILVTFAATASMVGFGYWAYSQSLATQESLDDVAALQSEIGELRERLEVLQDEWAYLNRPDRLRDLADINFARLGLLPIRPDQFGRVDEVAYPGPPQQDQRNNHEGSTEGEI